MIAAIFVRPGTIVAMVVLALMLPSCANSPTTKFYTLTGLQAGEIPAKEARVKPPVTIVAVGPVGIADYLDRPQIATRAGENELTFSEFDRWAGPLNEEINRALIENLSAILSPKGINVVSWKVALPGRIMVGLSVTRFEATSQGTVNFRAAWGLGRESDKTARLIRESLITRPFQQEGYRAVAAAMSAVLTDFSREIAAAIEETIKADETPAR